MQGKRKTVPNAFQCLAIVLELSLRFLLGLSLRLQVNPRDRWLSYICLRHVCLLSWTYGRCVSRLHTRAFVYSIYIIYQTAGSSRDVEALEGCPSRPGLYHACLSQIEDGHLDNTLQLSGATQHDCLILTILIDPQTLGQYACQSRVPANYNNHEMPLSETAKQIPVCILCTKLSSMRAMN